MLRSKMAKAGDRSIGSSVAENPWAPSQQRLSVLQVPLLSVSKCCPYAECHETEWREQQNDYAFADGALPVLGRRLRCAVAHGASLAESRRGL